MQLEDHKLLVSNLVFYSKIISPPRPSITGISKAKAPQAASVTVSRVNLGGFHANRSHRAILSNAVQPPRWHKLLIHLEAYKADMAFDEIVHWVLSV